VALHALLAALLHLETQTLLLLDLRLDAHLALLLELLAALAQRVALVGKQLLLRAQTLLDLGAALLLLLALALQTRLHLGLLGGELGVARRLELLELLLLLGHDGELHHLATLLGLASLFQLFDLNLTHASKLIKRRLGRLGRSSSSSSGGWLLGIALLCLLLFRGNSSDSSSGSRRSVIGSGGFLLDRLVRHSERLAIASSSLVLLDGLGILFATASILVLLDLGLDFGLLLLGGRRSLIVVRGGGRTTFDVVTLLENIFEVDLFVKELLVGGEWRHLVANVGHAADVLVGFGVDNKHFKWNTLFEIGIEFRFFFEKIHHGCVHRSLLVKECSALKQPIPKQSNNFFFFFFFSLKKKKSCYFFLSFFLTVILYRSILALFAYYAPQTPKSDATNSTHLSI
jgi:hypothetical protein